MNAALWIAAATTCFPRNPKAPSTRPLDRPPDNLIEDAMANYVAERGDARNAQLPL
jgi:hypothetical protein